MAKVKLTVKGLDKFKRDMRNAVEKKLPVVAAVRYRKEIVKNLQPSRKSGKLTKSWKIKIRPFKGVVYSNLSYAAIQNYGGDIKVTRKMINFFWYMYSSTKNQKWKNMATSKKGFVRIPAKNYLDIEDRRLSKIIDVQFNKITKNI